VASQQGHSDCVKLLIEHGAEGEEGHIDEDVTPMYWAAVLGHKEVAHFLLDR